MGKKQFEKLLALHCAPTLIGLKAASMVALPARSMAELQEFFAAYEHCFACKGLKVMELRQQKSHVLLLIYRPAVLKRLLRRAMAKKILSSCGYPDVENFDALLKHMKLRMGESADFPHEIGLFLGYPPHDVAGFIEHRGQNFLQSGYWKVYDNEKAVLKLFQCYKACTRDVCDRLQAGERLQSMIRSAA